jgi:hypothetical protein
VAPALERAMRPAGGGMIDSGKKGQRTSPGPEVFGLAAGSEAEGFSHGHGFVEVAGEPVGGVRVAAEGEARWRFTLGQRQL